MIRRFGTGRLTSSKKTTEDINPMDGIANLVDAMLVLAVGIMLALIMNWNVDIGVSEEYLKENAQELEAVEDLNQDQTEDVTSDEGLQEMGKVYKDPKTGKLYMITPNK
ncbi:MAG: DUF2149 domain-containing protein [Intestinibacter sp.]|uniref:DUF2149 domain-containing protein n=1 Tax=Intestinibacter sp. TaxID=1965304 RepID=UPI003F158242